VLTERRDTDEAKHNYSAAIGLKALICTPVTYSQTLGFGRPFCLSEECHHYAKVDE
jgi:hypothetical protein